MVAGPAAQHTRLRHQPAARRDIHGADLPHQWPHREHAVPDVADPPPPPAAARCGDGSRACLRRPGPMGAADAPRSTPAAADAPSRAPVVLAAPDFWCTARTADRAPVAAIAGKRTGRGPSPDRPGYRSRARADTEQCLRLLRARGKPEAHRSLVVDHVLGRVPGARAT